MGTINGNQIKKELKAAGFTGKISVTTDSSIRVTLKDYSMSAEAIKIFLASKYERISRCEATGEILSGGNRFVFVSYDWELDVSNYADTVREINSTFNWQGDSISGREYHVANVLGERVEFKHLSHSDLKTLVSNTGIIRY